MSDELDNIELYPVWRQALIAFRDAGFSRDEIVPHIWFYEAFNITMPNDDTPLKVAEKAKLQWLSQFTSFKSALLEQDQIDLVNEPGLGYRIMPPREQSKRALDDGVSQIKKAIRGMVDRSTHVNTGLLSAEERREHMDHLARIASLGSLFSRSRKLPTLDEE